MDKILTEEEKKKIYDILADQFISGLQKIYIGRAEQKYIAKKILKSVGNAKTLNEVINFLQSFAQKYFFFKPAIILLSREIDRQKELEIIDKLRKYIKN